MNNTFSKLKTREEILREIELYNMAVQKQDPDAGAIGLDGIDMIHFLTITDSTSDTTYDLCINGWELEPVNGKLVINIKVDYDGSKTTIPTDTDYTITHDALSIEQLREMGIRLSELLSELVEFKLN